MLSSLSSVFQIIYSNIPHNTCVITFLHTPVGFYIFVKILLNTFQNYFGLDTSHTPVPINTVSVSGLDKIPLHIWDTKDS
jgi:hypothetical protein